MTITPPAETAQDTVNINIDGRLTKVQFTGGNNQNRTSVTKNESWDSLPLILPKDLAKVCSDLYKKRGIDGIEALVALPETVAAEYDRAHERHIQKHGKTYHTPSRDANEDLVKKGMQGTLLDERMDERFGNDLPFIKGLYTRAYSPADEPSSAMFYEDLTDITRTIREQHQAKESTKALPDFPS